MFRPLFITLGIITLAIAFTSIGYLPEMVRTMHSWSAR